MSRASDVSSFTQRNENNFPDLLRAMPVKLYVKERKVREIDKVNELMKCF